MCLNKKKMQQLEPMLVTPKTFKLDTYPVSLDSTQGTSWPGEELGVLAWRYCPAQHS